MAAATQKTDGGYVIMGKEPIIGICGLCKQKRELEKTLKDSISPYSFQMKPRFFPFFFRGVVSAVLLGKIGRCDLTTRKLRIIII